MEHGCAVGTPAALYSGERAVEHTCSRRGRVWVCLIEGEALQSGEGRAVSQERRTWSLVLKISREAEGSVDVAVLGSEALS